MRRRSRSIESSSIQQQSSERSSEKISVLADAQARFAQFRAENPRGSVIPADLRKAALAARRSGVSVGDLQRTCGVSWQQLTSWERAAGSDRALRKRSQHPKRVRVFSVVDDRAGERSQPSLASMHELELRLGPWSISVRLGDNKSGGQR